MNETRVESFEEDEEELKNKCVKNGRRSALTSLSNQPLSINNNNIVTTTTSGSIVDSDEDLNASYRYDEFVLFQNFHSIQGHIWQDAILRA